jgi:hypothetical protein
LPGHIRSRFPAALARNAVQRCQAISHEWRRIGERMAWGEGDRWGSVVAGALLHSLETLEPVPPGVPAPVPAVPPAVPLRGER